MHVDDEVNDEAQRLGALRARARAIRERRREVHDGREHIAFGRMMESVDRGARLLEPRAWRQIREVDVVPRHRALPRRVGADRVGPEPELAERLSIAEVGNLASSGWAELLLGE